MKLALQQFIEDSDNIPSHFNVDNSLPLVKRQLDKVIEKMYKKEYPKLTAYSFFPTGNDGVSEFHETFTWYQWDYVGKAIIIASYSDDFPRVDLKQTEYTGRIKDIGASFGYNYKEVGQAALGFMNLKGERSNACRQSIVNKVNDIAWSGDAGNNIIGFLDNPNIPRFAVAATGTGSSTKWADKTAEQIYADLSAMSVFISDLTNDVFETTRYALPVQEYNRIKTLRLNEYNDATVLEMAEKKLGMALTKSNELKGKGVDGSGVMCGIEYDPDKILFMINAPFKAHKPVEKNLETIVNCRETTGGVIVKQPYSCFIAEGI